MFFLAGQTPLFLSSIHGRAAATRYLLDHGSNPAIDKTVLPLHGAAVKGHCEIVELFLSKGVDVDLYSIAGTPLLTAAISGQHSTMKILLEHHDDFNTTPIEVAANHGRRDIVEMLFPLTSPISTLSDWSIDGIISHVETFGLKPRVFVPLSAHL
uniref:Uncharacterized protein n=1 Tax=Oryza glaberrima TaxID=4538 RepID=I1QM17_ORYGL